MIEVHTSQGDKIPCESIERAERQAAYFVIYHPGTTAEVVEDGKVLKTYRSEAKA